MSDGGRNRASLGVKVWKSSQKLIAQRSAVRSIEWLGIFMFQLGTRGKSLLQHANNEVNDPYSDKTVDRNQQAEKGILGIQDARIVEQRTRWICQWHRETDAEPTYGRQTRRSLGVTTLEQGHAHAQAPEGGAKRQRGMHGDERTKASRAEWRCHRPNEKKMSDGHRGRA